MMAAAAWFLGISMAELCEEGPEETSLLLSWASREKNISRHRLNLLAAARPYTLEYSLVQDAVDCQPSSGWLGVQASAQDCANACYHSDPTADRFVWAQNTDKNCKCATFDCTPFSWAPGALYQYKVTCNGRQYNWTETGTCESNYQDQVRCESSTDASDMACTFVDGACAMSNRRCSWQNCVPKEYGYCTADWMCCPPPGFYTGYCGGEAHHLSAVNDQDQKCSQGKHKDACGDDSNCEGGGQGELFCSAAPDSKQGCCLKAGETWGSNCPASCHPGHTKLTVQNGQQIEISAAHIGDIILTPSGWEPIVLKMHNSSEESVYYKVFAGSFSMSLSPDHNLIANGREMEAKHVAVGDMLETIEGQVPIDRITQGLDIGQYHIMVPSGVYYADGVSTSDFVEANIPRSTWDAWRSYATLRFRMGLPMRSYEVDCYHSGLCTLDINWFAHALEQATGIDPWAMDSSKPLIHLALVSALVTEALDAALGQIQQMLW